jgi:hypothetical protein
LNGDRLKHCGIQELRNLRDDFILNFKPDLKSMGDDLDVGGYDHRLVTAGSFVMEAECYN